VSAAPVISVRSASFGYAGHTVVADLSLEVRPGEVVALLGPNGSGKSTLVRGLLGLNEHLGGEVLVLGERLSRRSDRTRLGYVPQRHTLSGSVRSTVREVVATGRLPHRPWWRPASRRDAELVEAALDTVGLADRAKADVATLSGGQQRRVLIARALVGEPSVLVMDEPTAGVDAASQEVLAEVLRRLVATGVTMLVVTHELAALRGIVDRIVEMDAGHIHFDGTPEGYAEHTAQIVHAASHGHHHDPPPAPPEILRGPYDPVAPVGEER
jgi:zinc transport system ATP-binding protein